MLILFIEEFFRTWSRERCGCAVGKRRARPGGEFVTICILFLYVLENVWVLRCNALLVDDLDDFDSVELNIWTSTCWETSRHGAGSCLLLHVFVFQTLWSRACDSWHLVTMLTSDILTCAQLTHLVMKSQSPRFPNIGFAGHGPLPQIVLGEERICWNLNIGTVCNSSIYIKTM